MQTYTHYLITAALDRHLRNRAQHTPTTGPSPAHQSLPPLASNWFLLGSVAPDLPLILITIIFLVLDLLQGCTLSPDPALQATSLCIQPDGQPGSRLSYLFNVQFFSAPWIMAAHNLFHAPLMIITLIATGYLGWRRIQHGTSPPSGYARLFWFGLACLIHTAIDIPIHHDDGPLLLFPLEWQTRFYSPISYWDPARNGTPFAVFEHLLALGLVFYLIVGWMRRRAPVEQS